MSAFHFWSLLVVINPSARMWQIAAKIN